MKRITTTLLISILAVSAFGCTSQRWLRYDAASLDPSKYEVAFENDKVRVLRVTYGPDEVSMMHQHPDSVVVFFDPGSADVAYPDGTTGEMSWDAREVMWSDAITHRPHNRDGRIEAIVVELKDRSTHASHR